MSWARTEEGGDNGVRRRVDEKERNRKIERWRAEQRRRVRELQSRDGAKIR